MKRFTCFSLVIAMILALTFTGCKKYENGPAFSLASKKSRVVNNWKVEKATAFDGTDETSYYSDMSLEFKKDNTYLEMESGSSYVGTWAFDGDKEKIVLTENGNSSSDTYIILRLKSNELWLKETSSYPEEIHFASK